MADDIYTLGKDDFKILNRLIKREKERLLNAKQRLPVTQDEVPKPLDRTPDFHMALRYLGQDGDNDILPNETMELESSRCSIMQLRDKYATPEVAIPYASNAPDLYYVYMPFGNDKDAEDGLQANAYIPVMRTKSGEWAGICILDDGVTTSAIPAQGIGTVQLRDSTQVVTVFNIWSTAVDSGVIVLIGVNTRQGQLILLGKDCP